MNKIYRVVWNRSSKTWVVAAENAKGRSKSASSSVTLLAAAMLLGASMGTASAQEAVDAPLRNVEWNIVADDEDEPKAKLRSIMFANAPSGVGSGGAWDTNSGVYFSDRTAFGSNAFAIAEMASAFGYAAAAEGKYATAIGAGSFAKLEQATALGSSTRATAYNATAIGSLAEATAANATALGIAAKATGESAVALGNAANANNEKSTAIGSNAKASAYVTTAIGADAKANHANSVALGANSVTSADGTVSVGNGTTLTRRITSVAAGINANDAVNKGQLDDLDAVAVKRDTSGNIAMAGNKVTGLGGGDLSAASTEAVTGQQLYATNNNVASLTTQLNNSKVAIGENATATGIFSVALGANAAASNMHAISLGTDTVASGEGAVALGAYSSASGNAAVALGPMATATHERSVALGAGSITSADNTVSVGSDTLKRKIVNLANGEADTDAVNMGQLSATNATLAALDGAALKKTRGAVLIWAIGASLTFVMHLRTAMRSTKGKWTEKSKKESALKSK